MFVVLFWENCWGVAFVSLAKSGWKKIPFFMQMIYMVFAGHSPWQIQAFSGKVTKQKSCGINGNVKYFSGIKRAGHVNFLCAKHSSNLICLFPFQNVEKGKRGPRGRQVSKIYFLLGFSRWFPFRCIRSNWQLIIHSFILIRLLA